MYMYDLHYTVNDDLIAPVAETAYNLTHPMITTYRETISSY